jgi:TPR repeat protein
MPEKSTYKGAFSLFHPTKELEHLSSESLFFRGMAHHNFRRTAGIFFAASFVFFVILSFSSTRAQGSAAENLSELQNSFEKIRDGFLSKVRHLPETPENLSNGTLAADAETLCANDLKNLSDRIDQQKIILKEKADRIESTPISQSDKSELRAAIDKQKTPLIALQQKIAAFSSALDQLRTSGIKSWQAIYDSYSSISGKEKAAAKLRGLTDAFCQPFLPKPIQSPSPERSTENSAKPSYAQNDRQKSISTTQAGDVSDERLHQQLAGMQGSTGSQSPPLTKAQPGSYYQPPSQSSEKILSFPDALQRAEQGDAYAQAVVSIYYATGYKVEKDLNQAAKYAILSAKQKHPLGIYRLGVMRQNGEGGIEVNQQEGLALKTASFNGLNCSMVGDPYAITALGVMSFRGDGVAKNEIQAAQLYKKAADMGYAPAQYTYSMCLLTGQGVPKNAFEARTYWQKAYDQGYGPALKGMPQP